MSGEDWAESRDRTPVQDQVLFRLPGDPEPEVEDEMRQQISQWVGSIPGLRRLRFGRDIGGRAEGYQFALLTEFSESQSPAA